jgi:hypothetical protein
MIAGRYRLMERLGAGGVGTVWRAFDEQLHREVAVKELRLAPELTADQRDEVLRAALAEARHAAQLSHPRIVGVYDVVAHRRRPHIVMQYVPGRSLEAVVAAQGPLPPQRVALLAGQLLDALAAAHAAGIIHRDLKPSNVLMTDSGDALLSDFSLAETMATGTISRTGHMVGTPGYIAPERVVTGRVGPEADLFGLGATLFYAVEGHAAFEHADPVAGAFAAAVRPHPRPERAGTLTPLIDALLEKEPDARASIARARELLAAGMGGAAPAQEVVAPDVAVPDAAVPGNAVPDPVVPDAATRPVRDLDARPLDSVSASAEAAVPPRTTPSRRRRAVLPPAAARALERIRGARLPARLVGVALAVVLILLLSAVAVVQSLNSGPHPAAGPAPIGAATAPQGLGDATTGPTGTGPTTGTPSGSGLPPGGAGGSGNAGLGGLGNPGGGGNPGGSRGPGTAGTVVTSQAVPQQVSAVLKASQSGANAGSADASGSQVSGGGTIASYTYNWGDGSAPVSTTGATAVHSYQHSGTYTVTLTVTASAGGTASTSAGLSLTVAPPHVSASVSAIPAAGTSTTVDVWGSTAGGWPIASFTVDWGDGSAPTSQKFYNVSTADRLTHDYGTCPSGFPALLTITETDTYGNSASIQTGAQLSCIS